MTRDSCFLFQRLPSSFYRDHAPKDTPTVAVRRRAAIGDVVASTVVVDKLHDLGFSVQFQADPGIQCVLKRHRWVDEVASPSMAADVVLDGVYEQSAERRTKSFPKFFMDAANQQLARRQIDLGPAFNCTPSLVWPDNVEEATRTRFSKFPRPFVFVCPRSHAWLNRTVYDDTWVEVAKNLPGSKFWLGLHPAPAGFHDLRCRHVDNLLDWLPIADLLITVDTGPMHLAAAFGVPIVAIEQASSPELHLSDQNDFMTIRPAGLQCLNCQKNICPVDPVLAPCQNIDAAIIIQAAKAKLTGFFDHKVSACVAVYRPKVEVLNRCIAHLTPQVDEIVIVRDLAGIFPEGATRNEKTRYLVKQENDIGYGRKMNFAVRNSVGRYVLHCNDDLFLDPTAVARLRDCMKPEVGIVSALLRKPDGRIQHAGKLRRPRERGWYHVNYNELTPTFKQPVEAENTCGACWLVDRKAHFACGCYDERFFLYAEDDAYCLQMRQAGYKIVFNPHASGIHLEHQSTNLTGALMKHLGNSNRLFGQLWGPYLTHNAERVPGNFDY